MNTWYICIKKWPLSIKGLQWVVQSPGLSTFDVPVPWDKESPYCSATSVSGNTPGWCHGAQS